ncbi:MAG: dehydratase [Chloroflexi bacterium]|nr:dehydratase [Chloroflexota bacterium]
MTVIAQPHGLYFEDLEVGDVIQTDGRTITEADIVLFAGLSGDHYKLHTNEEYAKTTPFGTRIAHGLLVLSIGTGLAMQLGFLNGTVEAFMGLDWQFRRPVFIGDTIHVEAEVAEKKPMKRLGGGLITLKTRILNQKGEVVQRGTWTILVKSRGATSAT